MKIHFAPTCSAEPIEVTKVGDVLIINGDEYDFGFLEEGDLYPLHEIPRNHFGNDVERVDGELILTLAIPFHSGSSEAVRFPASLIGPPDGPIAIPSDPEPVAEPTPEGESE